MINYRKLAVAIVLMTCSVFLAYWLKPNFKTAASYDNFHLETITPNDFGDWKVDGGTVVGIVNPQQKEVLDSIYSQTVSRTYVNSAGRRIMLSLAYGADQSHEKQVHKPEVCYPAQGFKIIEKSKSTLVTSSGEIPVMRLTAQLGGRTEAITYWIRIGDDIVRGVFEQNKARVTYGFKGIIPDGLLYRVSEINGDTEQSYLLQEQFVRDFIAALNADSRHFFIGKTSR